VNDTVSNRKEVPLWEAKIKTLSSSGWENFAKFLTGLEIK